MIKVKEFWDWDGIPIEKKINKFLDNEGLAYVDVKYLINGDGDALALLVYKEDER